MAKKESYGLPLEDEHAERVLAEIEKWRGRVPYELTPLALKNLRKYINYLEDIATKWRKRPDTFMD